MKNGELHHNDVFLGINNKNLFLFDPKQQEQAISMKNYNTNPAFSCFSSTAQGHFAVGNEKGEIRLYKEIGKNAKNIIHTDAGNENFKRDFSNFFKKQLMHLTAQRMVLFLLRQLKILSWFTP